MPVIPSYSRCHILVILTRLRLNHITDILIEPGVVFVPTMPGLSPLELPLLFLLLPFFKLRLINLKLLLLSLPAVIHPLPILLHSLLLSINGPITGINRSLCNIINIGAGKNIFDVVLIELGLGVRDDIA